MLYLRYLPQFVRAPTCYRGLPCLRAVRYRTLPLPTLRLRCAFVLLPLVCAAHCRFCIYRFCVRALLVTRCAALYARIAGYARYIYMPPRRHALQPWQPASMLPRCRACGSLLAPLLQHLLHQRLLPRQRYRVPACDWRRATPPATAYQAAYTFMPATPAYCNEWRGGKLPTPVPLPRLYTHLARLHLRLPRGSYQRILPA